VRINHRPNKVCFLDFETQSFCDLKNSTTHQFAKHKTTKALTCVVKRDGVVHKFGPYLDAAAKERLAALTEGGVIVAHNAPFDACIWEFSEQLPEREWFDTLPCARAAGLPGKLDEISKILNLGGKNKHGKALIDLLCALKPGRPIPPVGPAHQLLLDYNTKDVDDLEAIYHRVKDFGEPDVIRVDRVINDRGIPVDRNYLQTLQQLFDENAKDSRERFADKIGDVSPTSSKQMTAWVRAQGFNVPACNKVVLKDLFADPSKYYGGDTDGPESELASAFEAVRDAMELRREIVRVSGSKVETAMAILEDDGRIRDQHVYFGAHTGRWSGRALQVHNMPATSGFNSDEVFELFSNPTYKRILEIAETASVKRRIEDPTQPRVAVSDVLASLLRPMVRSPIGLLYGDYAAVELRGLAWLAGGGRLLTVLSDPRASIYLDMGDVVFKRRISKSDLPRYSFVKQLVLGCNYGMSGSKFEHVCRLRNVSTATLAEAGLSAKDSVKLFRETYPELPAVWKAYGDAVKECVQTGNETFAGRCFFTMVKGDLHAVLPSGRPLVYRNARIEMLVPGYMKLYGMAEQRIPTVVYDKPNAKFGRTGFLYGSKVAENVTQAMCRDLLADALVNLESEGLNPVLHVHDEGCCEKGPEYLDRLMEVMSTPPSWASDFPLLVEGCAAPIWTKQTKKFTERKALCGKLL
jgi:DNA polymerase